MDATEVTLHELVARVAVGFADADHEPFVRLSCLRHRGIF